MQIIEQDPLAAPANSPSRAREENLFFQLLSFTQDGTQATSYPEGPWFMKHRWDWNAWQNSAHFRKSFQREGYVTAKELRSTTLAVAGTKARSKTCTNRLAGAGEASSTDDGETSAVKTAGSLWKLCGEQKPLQLNFNLQLLQMSERHPLFTVGSWNN